LYIVTQKSIWRPLKPFEVSHAEEETKEEESHEGKREETEGFTGQIGLSFGKSISAKENTTVKLLCEASEYFLLEMLSSHLFRCHPECCVKPTASKQAEPFCRTRGLSAERNLASPLA